jgi:hypothetical protein
LLDLEGLSLVHEGRDRNRPDVVRNGDSVTSGMVAASHPESAQKQGQRRATAQWILPRGRDAAMASAHSTALAAATRRLSEAAHSQSPFG